MLAVLATGRVEQIAWRFLRLIGLIAFALACSVSVWVLAGRGMTEPSAATQWSLRLGYALAAGAAIVVFLAPVAERTRGGFRLICSIAGIAGLAGGSLSSLAALGQHASGPLALGMVIASQVLGGLLLGAITVAWLLGHAYLTATKMTIGPLRHFSRLLSLSIAARIAFMVISIGLAWHLSRGGPPSIVTRLEASWLILLLRVGVGLIAVAVFAYMVADCVRLRSTQSATGILYFGSVFALIGELACQQLIAECGWPV